MRISDWSSDVCSSDLHAGSRRAGLKRGSGSGKAARGRRTVAAMRRTPGQRRVTVMARIARHKGAHYRAAPLAKHIKYLERDGVSRDGRDASMFDARTDRADRAEIGRAHV